MVETLVAAVEVEALLWDRQSTARITTGSAHNGQDRTSAKTVGEIKTACGTRSFIVPLYECITKHLLQLPYVVHRFTAYMLRECAKSCDQCELNGKVNRIRSRSEN